MSTYPATIPASATAYTSLEQQTGWTDQGGPPIGPATPSVFEIVQVLPPPIQPPMTMTLRTVGVEGKYCGWMAERVVTAPAGQFNSLLRTSVMFDSVAGLQAFEIGRRRTDENGVTDNGQTNFVPLGDGTMAVWIVPSAAGGWQDTGLRFPTFVGGPRDEIEQYWVSDADGALSLVYV